MEETNFISIKEQVIEAFKQEFSFVVDKFELIDLLSNNSPMEIKTIENLKLPSADNNIVWHPGVYIFIGNNKLYKVGVSMRNSRERVMQHLKVWTNEGGNCIWDINKFADKSIFLFNIKKKVDRHWLLALEVFIENKYEPLIKAKRIG